MYMTGPQCTNNTAVNIKARWHSSVVRLSNNIQNDDLVECPADQRVFHYNCNPICAIINFNFKDNTR